MLHQAAQLAQEALVDAAGVDLRIVHRLQQHPQHHVLVARVVLHGALGIAHGADELALAAARAHLHGREQADEGLLVGEAALADVVDEAVEGKGEGPDGQLAVHELGRVHDVARVHALLEAAQGLHLLGREKRNLRDADAVLARDLAAHFLALGHDAGRGLLGLLQHPAVVGIDRDVHMAVAVARVHVACDDDAARLHVGADGVDIFGKVRIGLGKAVEIGLSARPELVVRELGGRNVARGGAGGPGKLLVEGLVLHGEAGQAPHLLQGVAVGPCRVLEIELFEEEREIRDALHGDDHVLVELEARGAPGDDRKAVPVLPEEVGLFRVARHDDVHVVLGLGHVHDVGHALVEEIGVVAVHLEDDDRDGQSLELPGLALVLDGLHILGVEFLQRRKVGVVPLLADAVAQGHEVAHHERRRVHGAAEKFQHHDARVERLLVDDEAGLGDDAVHAFLLHPRQAPQGLVGHVLAEAGQADFVAAQVDDVAHAAAHVLDGKDRGLVREDFVAGVVLALHGDDLARGRDHLPPEEVVEGGAVFKGAGAARVFGHIAADGRGLLGGRVHGEHRARRGHGVDDLLGERAGLAGDGHGSQFDGPDAREPRHAHDHGALARGHGAARHARAAAARDERELHVIGKAHERGHLLGIVRLHHEERQLHAQVRGVGGVFHKVRGLASDALGREDVRKRVQQLFAKGRLRLVGGPEHGDAFGNGRGVIVGQRHGLALERAAHALAHKLGVDEGIIGDEEELLGDADGEVADRFRPFGEIVRVDLEDAVDHMVRRDGNVRALVAHGRPPLGLRRARRKTECGWQAQTESL